MITYLLISKQIDGEGVFFGYNEDGLLVQFEVRGKVTPVQLEWLHNHLPLDYDKDFVSFKVLVEQGGQKAKIVEVQSNLSFEKFWEDYNYKLGKKSQAKKMWEAMDEADKIRALAYIKRYNQFLSQHPGQDKQYPTTFLSYRQWEN
jgi:hypothetical protein